VGKPELQHHVQLCKQKCFQHHVHSRYRKYGTPPSSLFRNQAACPLWFIVVAYKQHIIFHPIIRPFSESYGGAVAVSCGASLGLNIAFNKMPMKPQTRNFAKMFVPFFAVAAANWSNVYLMRWNEIKYGIDVFDEQGEIRGKSKTAGSDGLVKVAISRLLTPVPVMTLPPLFFFALNKTSLLKKFPRLTVPINLGLIALCLGTGLPVAIALFPQVSTIATSRLEPEFQNLRDKNGVPITQLYYNKGI
jgi:hypothetical protein